ncbi:MAG TPA: SDR family oxidoreductase [Mycobacteriales bacterium]|nr:SDR family oxidoreductase [Mycobacteriales bacterium]
MSNELDGKVAIVTGAANGIGKGIAEMFVAEGARVVVADIDDDAGTKVAGELGDAAHFVHTDVSDAASINGAVDAAVARFGRLDVMVNNAGISGSYRRLMMDDLRDFHRVIEVDLLGVMLGTQAAARKMAPGGSIISTTSIAGIQPGVGFSSYRAAKAAVIHFSRCAAIELAELGLRVNVIAPGNIATQINAAFDTESIVARIQPLQRLGSPADIAHAAVYLASDRSAQVTGLVLPVDGGTTVGQPPLPAESVMRHR